MKTGFTSSVIVHSAVLIIAIVGLGSAKPLMPPAVDSIAVDLVPISDVTNIRAGSLDSKVVETDTPAVAKSTEAAKLAQPTGNTEENQVKPEETDKATPAPVVNTAPEPVPEVQPEPEPDPVKEKAPDPEPVVAPEPVTKPVEAAPVTPLAAPETPETPADAAPAPALRTASLDKIRADYKKQLQDEKQQADDARKKQQDEQKRTAEAKKQQDKAAKEADQVAALINSEKSRGATTGAGGDPTLGKNTGTSATLSQSALDGLVAQIKNCMSVPPGSAEAGITAQLHFFIDASGMVTQTPDVLNATPNALDLALASAAKRAVMRCGPYAMAMDQEVKATFDPRELL